MLSSKPSTTFLFFKDTVLQSTLTFFLFCNICNFVSKAPLTLLLFPALELTHKICIRLTATASALRNAFQRKHLLEYTSGLFGYIAGPKHLIQLPVCVLLANVSLVFPHFHRLAAKLSNSLVPRGGGSGPVY